MISPKTTAARKKKANVTSADRSAILDALPRNDQFRLYSPYEMTNAHAAASAPNTSPRTTLSSRFTTASVAASSGHRGSAWRFWPLVNASAIRSANGSTPRPLDPFAAAATARPKSGNVRSETVPPIGLPR
jgi:hypothetical protein